MVEVVVVFVREELSSAREGANELYECMTIRGWLGFPEVGCDDVEVYRCSNTQQAVSAQRGLRMLLSFVFFFFSMAVGDDLIGDIIEVLSAVAEAVAV